MLWSKAWTFSFPPQETKLRAGQDVRDPATGSSAGELLALDRDAHRLVLKRGPSLVDVRNQPIRRLRSRRFHGRVHSGALHGNAPDEQFTPDSGGTGTIHQRYVGQ